MRTLLAEHIHFKKTSYFVEGLSSYREVKPLFKASALKFCSLNGYDINQLRVDNVRDGKYAKENFILRK